MSKQKILTDQDWEKIREIADVHSLQISTKGWVYLICPKTTINPQELAMIQALYSRDPASILFHLLEVATKGAENFMAQFYTAYGHKSIGDCGNILIAYEGVSMLAAKAVQDSQLYAGQEASTRYMNFSDQEFLAPDDTPGNLAILTSSCADDVRAKPQGIQEKWREFYMNNIDGVTEHLKQVYPYESFDLKEDLAKAIEKKPELADEAKGEAYMRGIWLKTMKARAFDIMRGFLPAGATTCVAWWTSISHCGDHLSWLRCHVLSEVAELALATETLLKEVYPSSFDRPVYAEREEYKKDWYEDSYYLEFNASDSGCYVGLTSEQSEVGFYRQYILTRPKGVELPWQIGQAFNVRWEDEIDFGSFRDQQRHRAVIQRMGLLGAKLGFHGWYIENLPPALRESAARFVAEQVEEIGSLGLDDINAQYLYPMGMKVATIVTGSLSKFFYLIELRCQRTVHPTLHANVYELAKLLRIRLSEYLLCEPQEIPLFIDENVGELTLKRGTQDIIKTEVATEAP